MSLLFIEGFEDDSTTFTSGKWSGSGAAATLKTGRTGIGSAKQLTAGMSLSKTASVTQEHATFIVGFGAAVYTTNAVSPIIALMSDSATTSHITITWDAAGSSAFPVIKRGAFNGTTIGTSTIAISYDVWAYMELKATLHDTTGSFEFRVNGVLAASATNIDTRNAGTKAVFDSVRIYGNAPITFDDLYLCNGAGTVNNDFLGDCTVETLYPNGNGDTNQFIGSDGNSTDNYLLVDEAGTPSTTDYTQSSVAGERDLYQLTNLTRSSGSIRGVQLNSYALKDDAGARSIKNIVKTGGTVYSSPDLPLSTSVAVKQHPFDQNPGTSALWTFAEVNALQAGVEVV